MVKEIVIEKFGGPEVMVQVDAEPTTPAADEIAIEHTAIGLNYIDTYHRSGLYQIAMPSGLGLEAAGTIIEVGADVADLSPGDRVAYCTGPIGAYAERHVIKADRAIKLPDHISDDLAAASMLKGLTVQYLIRQIYKVSEGDTVLVHAAAGGVGLIACQWLKHIGATTIGTVSTDEKAAEAKAAGCDHAIIYTRESISDRVAEITKGAKLPVVFDGVGAATWEASLDCLQPRGLMVSFGNASGPVKDVNLGVLAAKGSLFVTRPTLFDYTATHEALQSAADDLFAVLGDTVNTSINAEYALEDVVRAHEDLEARRTTGSTILRP
ncbi:MAG: quinone oxidoreductase [Pseudomonadota bacterium]